MYSEDLFFSRPLALVLSVFLNAIRPRVFFSPLSQVRLKSSSFVGVWGERLSLSLRVFLGGGRIRSI